MCVCVQSYSQVQNFANQEAAKAAMNHMRWGLQAQVTWASAPSVCRLGSVHFCRRMHSRICRFAIPLCDPAVYVFVLPHAHCSTSSLLPGWGMPSG
jgi:hypothetical protein